MPVKKAQRENHQRGRKTKNDHVMKIKEKEFQKEFTKCIYT